MTGSVRSIKYQAIDELEVAAVNPKRHDIDKLRASVKHHGFVEPMVVDERTGRLVAGHGRLETLKAMRDAGLEPPDGIRVFDGKWLAPVLRGWASDNDAQASAYLVASNRLVEAGGWDEQALAGLLESVNAEGLLEASGYDDGSLEELLRKANAPNPFAEGQPAGSPEDEWEGMPEFQNEDTKFRSIIVHFMNADDVEKFARAIGQTIGPATKSIRFPEVEKRSLAGLVYVEPSESDVEPTDKQ